MNEILKDPTYLKNDKFYQEYKKRFPKSQPLCHDCAFRPDSPEVDDGTMYKLLDQIDRGVPFYCHRKMDVDPKTGDYITERNERNEPIGAPLCSGFAYVITYTVNKDRKQKSKSKG